MSLFAIPAADIDAAGRSIDADLPVEWLDGQLADCDVKPLAPGHLSVRLSRSGTDIVVRGRTKATLEATCGRCLAPAKIDVDTELGLLLQQAKPVSSKAPSKKDDTRAARSGGAKGAAAAAPEASAKKKKASKEKDLPEYEFTSGEADVDTYDGETVVLDDFVREAILLEVPIFPLCSEACPGIAPAASDVVDDGDAPRVDPRLAPLGALLATLSKAEAKVEAKSDLPSKAGSDDSTNDSGVKPRSTAASHRKKLK